MPNSENAINNPSDLIESETFFADDRGNVIQFYDVKSGKIVGEINREATVNGVPDMETWIGSTEVKEWAINNGYPDIIEMPIAIEFIAETSAKINSRPFSL